MASQEEGTTPKNPMASAKGVFFSPPEAPKVDAFSPVNPSSHDNGTSYAHIVSHPDLTNSSRSLMSPPVSPAIQTEQESGTPIDSHRAEISDPELFPATTQAATTSPLFRPSNDPTTAEPDAIDLHIQAREAAGYKGPRATREEYELMSSFATSFKSKVVEKVRDDPAAWLKREMEYLDAYPPRFPQTQSKDKETVSNKRQAADMAPPAKRQRQAPKAKVEKLPAPKRAARSSLKETSLDESGAPIVVKHRRRVSRATPTTQEPKDYREVPDYSPPVSAMLPGKNLKMDWKGQPLDLHDDPDRHLLDDAEVPLAAVLRLTGGQYLFAKRRIFEKCVELAHEGKVINKTKAQAVCRMDVNKASRLWAAFDKVGWLDLKHFTRYL